MKGWKSGMAAFSASRHGVGMALGAAILFGASAPFAKLLLRSTSPQLLAGLLYLGSGLGLAAVRLRRREQIGEARLERRDTPWLVAAIVSGGVLGPLLLLVGLDRTPAASASLLLNFEAAFTVLIAWFVVGESFDRRIAVGMLAILVGGVVLSWEGALAWGGIAGPLAVVGACLCWAVDNNLTQKVAAADPVQIATVKGLAAGAVNTVVALGLGASWPPVAVLGGALVLGFLSYGASLVLFVLALRHLGTARTSAYFSAAPFMGAGLSLVVFGHVPTPLFALGAGLMAMGVALHMMEKHEHEHAHEEFEHEHRHVHDQHHRHAHQPEDPAAEPHSHRHRHEPLVHRHPHYPDFHHRHGH